MLLMFRDVFRNESLRRQTADRLQQAGIQPSRIEFGWQLPRPHLQIYSQIDILLDVFPWGSGTIAYDAMWMGVPIPTIAGDRGACRATASMMYHCGLPELIADTPGHYVEIVSRLSEDTSHLNALRHQIRPAMASTVCNGRRFAQDIEAVYRTFRNRYLAQSVRDRKI